MATTTDNIQVATEETPRYENAPSTTPYRVSTTFRYPVFQELAWNPEVQDLDRGDEMRATEGAPARLVDGYLPAGSFSARGYVNDMIWWLSAAGFVPTFTAGGAGVRDENETTVTGVNALNSATINVASTAEFPSAGSIVIGSDTITYTGTTATSFTGCNNHAATTGGEIVNGNVPTGATKVVFNKRGGATAKTLQLTACAADENIWIRGQGVGVSRLGMNARGEVTGDLMGLVWKRLTVDPNITPAYETSAIPNLRQGDFTLQAWLASAGTASDFSFEIANGLERIMSLYGSYYGREMLHADTRVAVTGTRPSSTLTPADIDANMARTTFAAKAKWVSPKVVGATAYPYSMWLRMPACQYTGGNASAFRNNRRFTGDWSWFAAWDETAGYDARITLVGAVTAAQYETLV